MYKDLIVCPICSFEGDTSRFLLRRQQSGIDEVLYKCPSCQRELKLREKDRVLIIIISTSVLCFFVGFIIAGISKAIVGIIFTLTLGCIWIIKKLGFMKDIFKVHLVPR